jgi:hypothetical protein
VSQDVNQSQSDHCQTRIGWEALLISAKAKASVCYEKNTYQGRAFVVVRCFGGGGGRVWMAFTIIWALSMRVTVHPGFAGGKEKRT